MVQPYYLFQQLDHYEIGKVFCALLIQKPPLTKCIELAVNDKKV